MIVREKEDPEPEPDDPSDEPDDPSGEPDGDIDPDGPGEDDMDDATDGGSGGDAGTKEKAAKGGVNTGDYENLAFWVTLLILSSLLLALTAVIRRKHH